MEILLFEILLSYISMKYRFHNNLYELILKYVFKIPFLYIIIISEKSLFAKSRVYQQIKERKKIQMKLNNFFYHLCIWYILNFNVLCTHFSVLELNLFVIIINLLSSKNFSQQQIGTILFNFAVDLKYINNLLIIYICVVSKYLPIIICFMIYFNFIKNFLINLIILYVRCVIFKFFNLF